MTVQGFDIATIDLVLIVAYFFVVFGFGAYFGKFIKSTSDFFFSGRKFAWWIIGVSMIATVVGSYSFIKYSQAGYTYGLGSSMSYLNDWFFMPLWMFGWLPIIYFTRMSSVPEYFERRFDTKTRVMAIIFIATYLVGYIGINFFTLGVALNALYPDVGILSYAAIVAVITAVYVTSGGQTAVIMTDLLQGVILLIAGLAILYLGFEWFGDGDVLQGAANFWHGLPLEKRYGLAHFNDPPSFNFVGVFWQDAIAGTFATYFFNQGILMRFLSLKSVHEGRKAIIIAFVVLFPIAVLVIGLLHYEAFRTRQGLVLPLVTALLSVVWGVGIMGLMKVPMDIFNSPTPILILAVAAGHHAWAKARTFLAAGNPHPEEVDPFLGQLFYAPVGVGEVGVAAIHDDIARLQQGQQAIDNHIHGLARRHQQHERARPANGRTMPSHHARTVRRSPGRWGRPARSGRPSRRRSPWRWRRWCCRGCRGHR